MKTYKNVNSYIQGFPKDTQKLLKQVRAVIQKAAPRADEDISYGMVGYKLAQKPLVYFGGFKKHIGFYATPSGNAVFAKELSKYKTAKGSIQFPIDKPIPFALIAKMTKFRAKQNLAQLKRDK